MAHIGVLKAIDEAGLNIDYITGTSMGAILAGMYASGYSGKDIERIAGEMDWSSAMSSSVGYRNVSIETKDQYERYLLEMPVKGFSVRPSTGFVEPQELMLKFSEVFYPVYQTKDFSQLPIPFKCIATDISNGEVVVLDKGNIAQAVRSSMAIPGVFTATEYDGTKLVDGGIVRNFPVQNVIDMGADYVIGVNLFSGLSGAKEINSMIDVMLQVMNFSDAKDLVYEKSLCDMVIEPDVSRFSSASFAQNKEIMAVGDSIGQDFLPLFQQLADSLHNAYGAPYAPKERMRAYPDSVRITGFTFYGLKDTDESLLMHNLDLEVGQWYTPLDINKAMRRAYSSQYYKNLSYELLPDTTGGYSSDVTMRCNVSELSLSLLKVGLNYNTFSNAALILGFNRKHLFGHRSSLDAKVAISESFQFMLRNRLFFGKNYNNNFDQQYRFTRYEIPIYGHKTTKKDFIYSYLHNNFSLTFGHVHNTSHSTDVTLGYEIFSLTPEFRGPTQIDGSIKNMFISLTDHYNSLDRKYMPTRGANLKLRLYWAPSPQYSVRQNVDENGWPLMEGYKRRHTFRYSMEGDFYQTPVDKLTFVESFGLSTTYYAQTFVHQTALGGPQPFMPSHFAFYGINTASRFAPGVAMGRLGAQYRLMGELYLGAFVNGALTFKGLEAYMIDDMPLEVEETLVGAGITVAYNLARMPFDITLMSARNYGVNVSVNVGFPF